MISTRHNLAEVIGKKTLNITEGSKLAKEIAQFLLDEKLTNDLDSIMRDVMQYRLDNGIVEVTAISANQLSDTDLKDIEALLHREYPDGKRFIIDQTINPEMIGGVKLEFPGSQLDLSLRARLSTFKQKIVSEM